MNVCKAPEVGDGGAVDKSVGMRTSVRCESMGMRGSMLGSMRGSMLGSMLGSMRE